MRKSIKYSLIGVTGLLAVGAGALMLGTYLGEAKLNRTIVIKTDSVELTLDATRIEHGRYLYSTRGCAECHGTDGGGREVLNEGGMLIVAPNITSGANSVTRTYSGSDWARTIRHGVKPNQKPALVMPSEDYAPMTDADLTDLVSYVHQLPAVDGKAAVIQLPALVKTLYAAGKIMDAAEKIDHDKAPPAPVQVAVSKEHGAYIANNCIGCHGAGLSGGRIPGAPPSWPAAANLTPGEGTVMTRYPTAAAFAAMLRSGKRPDGSSVNASMPFASLSQFNDTDIAALHLYLQTVKAKPTGQR